MFSFPGRQCLISVDITGRFVSQLACEIASVDDVGNVVNRLPHDLLRSGYS
jgi:hypothetical protein